MTGPRDAGITDRENLAGRMRVLLTDEPSLDERSMFGSRAFMVREKLLVCAFKQGRLLVRVDAEREDELLERPGATRAVMAGRDMGLGWVSVEPDAIGDDRELTFWLEVALDYNRSQTASSD